MKEEYKPTILIVDDDKANVESLERILKREGYDCLIAFDGKQGLDVLRKSQVDLVVTDMSMPNMGGLELLKAIKAISDEIEVIMVTAYGTVEKAVEAMQQGAFHFITKPFKRKEIVQLCQKALERVRLIQENEQLKQRIHDYENPRLIVGPSVAMGQTMNTLQLAGPKDVTVTIRGESGTGKELIAKELHRLSPRHDKGFVALNCTAFPETLIDSELFGYEKGAFTGADGPKSGRFEQADGGTLFLDEIGELPPNVQVKLLRVLQERTIERLGGTKSIPIDIRLISATHRNLEEEVKAGRFREDLYYRINVIELNVPPLRERPEDIAVLTQHFINKYSQKYQRPPLHITPEALESLQSYDWPGNVRQLENVIQKSVVLAPGQELQIQDLPEQIHESKTQGNYFMIPFGTPLDEIERHVISETLRRTGDKKTTAQLLGVATRTIYRKLESFQQAEKKETSDTSTSSEDDS